MMGVQNMSERPPLFRQRRQYMINNRGVYGRRHAGCRLMRQPNVIVVQDGDAVNFEYRHGLLPNF
jgi:hypothetical protein